MQVRWGENMGAVTWIDEAASRITWVRWFGGPVQNVMNAMRVGKILAWTVILGLWHTEKGRRGEGLPPDPLR